MKNVKYLVLGFMIFLSSIANAQNNDFATLFQITGSSSFVSDTTYSITGVVTDYLNVYDGSSVAIGDSLFYTEEGVLYAGVIKSIQSVAGNGVTFRFGSTEARLNTSPAGAMFGSIVISRKNTQGYCSVPANTAKDLASLLENRFKKRLGADIANVVIDSLGYKLITRTQADANYLFKNSSSVGDSSAISTVFTGEKKIKSTLITNNGASKVADSVMFYNPSTRTIKLYNATNITFNSDSLLIPTYITKTQAKNQFIVGADKTFSITTDGDGNRFLEEDITNADPSTYTPLNNKVLKVWNPVSNRLEQVTQDSLIKPAIDVSSGSSLIYANSTKIGQTFTYTADSSILTFKGVVGGDSIYSRNYVTGTSTPSRIQPVGNKKITNEIWKNPNIVSGKTIDFGWTNTNTWKKIGEWSTSDFNILANGSDQTNNFQSMLNYFAVNSTASIIQIDSGVRINFCNITAFPKHIEIHYYANTDMCRSSLYAGQVLTERKVLITGGSDTGNGVVNERIIESPFNPGFVIAVNPSIGGYEQNLTGGQTMRSPARTTFLSTIDKIDAWNLGSERQDTSTIRGATAINGVNFSTYNFKVTINGVGTSNTTGLVVGDIVMGNTSRAVGLVYAVTTTTTSICWRFGQFLVGETIRITTTSTSSSGTISSISSPITETTVLWAGDEVNGSLNVWALPYNNNPHRFTVGKGMMIAAPYDGSRTGMFNGEASGDRYIGFRNSYSSAATGKYLYWDDSKDALDVRNKGLEKIASFTNANDFLVGDSTKSANFGGRIIQLGNTSDNITTIGSRSAWGDWGWNNYSNLYYLQRNSNSIIPLKIADAKIGIGGTLVTPSYTLDIDANTGSTGNPIRALGFQQGSTTDSLVTSASGVLRRLALSDIGLGVTSTSGNRLPQLTTTQRDVWRSAGSLTGDIFYNSTLNKYQVSDGNTAAWTNLVTENSTKSYYQALATPASTVDVSANCQLTGQGYVNLVSADFTNIATTGRKYDVFVNGLLYVHNPAQSATSGNTYTVTGTTISPFTNLVATSINSISIKINP